MSIQTEYKPTEAEMEARLKELQSEKSDDSSQSVTPIISDAEIELINNNLTWYTKEDIMALKDEIRTWWLLFEAELIKQLSNSSIDWEQFSVKTIIDFYLDVTQNAMKVNNNTWELIPDEATRMKAMDKLLKIITWNNWSANKININVNNTTNNLWNNIPKAWEKLLY